MDSLETFFEPETAKMLNLSLATLKRMRKAGTGPSYLKVGCRVRYRLPDLVDWLDSKRVSVTLAVTRHGTPNVAPMGNT